MKTKIILILSFIILFGLGTFVSALDGIMIGGNDSPYTVEVDVIEGWNIIAGIIPDRSITVDSQIKKENIKAVWYYAPELNKYVQIHPNIDTTSQIDDDVALTSAMWVYSDKAGRLKYSTLEDYMPLNFRELRTGYNFVTMTPDMYSGILDGAGYVDEYFIWNKIKGNCNIEKINFWDAANQNWYPIDPSNNFGEEYGDFIGMGMVVKVNNNCKLNIPVEVANQPPQLP